MGKGEKANSPIVLCFIQPSKDNKKQPRAILCLGSSSLTLWWHQKYQSSLLIPNVMVSGGWCRLEPRGQKEGGVANSWWSQKQ